jgi:hypothetical protein
MKGILHDVFQYRLSYLLGSSFFLSSLFEVEGNFSRIRVAQRYLELKYHGTMLVPIL